MIYLEKAKNTIKINLNKKINIKIINDISNKKRRAYLVKNEKYFLIDSTGYDNELKINKDDLINFF